MLEFFRYFSEKYKNNNNILWELFNEPYKTNSADMIECIKDSYEIIKEKDPNAVIITGRGLDKADALFSLLEANSLDIMVSNHFYISSGLQDKENIKTTTWFLSQKGYFVTEWGNSEGSGDGIVSDEYADYFMRRLHQYKIPQCVWKFTYQPMTTSMLEYTSLINKDCYKEGFSLGDLSHNGKFYLDRYAEFAYKKDM